MVDTIRLDPPRDRTIVWGAIISIALHVLVIALPPVRNALDELSKFEVKQVEPVIQPIEFTLVSPPQEPIPTDQKSRYLSTVNSAARDPSQTDADGDTPHGEGEIPFVDNPAPPGGEEGGGAGELPPMPEVTESLDEAFKRSKIYEEQSPTRQLSMPEYTPEFRNDGGTRASIGGIQLNTTAWDFAPYLLDLKHRIKQHWIPPLAFTALGAIHGYTVVVFRIYPDGQMDALEVVDEEGHESLHRASVNAIKGAAPFRKLPDDFPEDYLEIRFGFYYLLPGDAERYFQNNQRSSD